MPSFRIILNLIRFPNLLIIAVTLLFVRYLIILPGLVQAGFLPGIGTLTFILIIVNTMFIAAGGYVLNDCYDIETDRINRPGKQIIGKALSRRTGYQVSSILLLLAFSLGITVSFIIRSTLPAIVFFVAIIAVWWYAARLKKTLIWGNIAVAFMTACTIGMIWLFDYLAGGALREISLTNDLTTILVIVVMTFAGSLNLVREIIKDMEDMPGDLQQHCRTLPIAAGIRVTKRVAGSLTMLILVLLMWCLVWLWSNEFVYVFIWLLLFVLLPLLWFLWVINLAKISKDYHKASALLRWIMVSGLLSIAILQLNISIQA